MKSVKFPFQEKMRISSRGTVASEKGLWGTERVKVGRKRQQKDPGRLKAKYSVSSYKKLWRKGTSSFCRTWISQSYILSHHKTKQNRQTKLYNYQKDFIKNFSPWICSGNDTSQQFQTYILRQGPANYFCIGSDDKYLKLCGAYSLFWHYSSLPL